MARFIDAIDLPISIEEAFDYLADFANCAEWDPGVAEARRLTPGKIGLGSRFEVVVAPLGQRVALDYEITAYDRPHRLVIAGSNSALCSVDEVTFTSRPDGTRVSYEARLELNGILAVAEPLLDLIFQRIARVAARGLRERVSASAHAPIDRAGPDDPHRSAA